MHAAFWSMLELTLPQHKEYSFFQYRGAKVLASQ